MTQDKEAELYWLQFADFFDWPFLQYFDSFQDLANKLNAAQDYQEIHRGMKISYETRQYETLQQWCDIIPNLGPSPIK